MLGQVEVATVGDSLELRPADREQVLDVAGGTRVVRQLIRVVGPEAQVVGPDPQVRVPVHPLHEPVLVPLLRLGRRDEELHLHLLELARAEDEVAGGDLVAEALADLSDPERRLLAGELEVVLEVEEDPLSGLGAQVDGRALLLDRPDVVSNIRLKSRASVRSHSGVSPGCLEGLRPHADWSRWSARKRSLHVRQSTSGSVNPARCPLASHVRGCWMMAESSATTSSRSWSMARHHWFLTLFLSSTP